MKTITKKTYDSVKEVRKARTQLSEETKGMTPEEIIQFISAKAKGSGIKVQGE